MRKYFYTDGISKFGPFSKEELKVKKISRNTKFWFYGLDNWTEISKIDELYDIILSLPPDIRTIESFNNIVTKPVIVETNKNPMYKVIKKYNLRKWAIGIVVVITISSFVLILIRNQSKVNLYNIIVANSYESNENFEIYVEKFYRELEYHGIHPKKPKQTIIRFSKLDQLDNTTHIHGLSFGNNDDEKIEIYINPSTWKQFSKPMRYFLMYHELSHDVLNLDDLTAKSVNEGKLMYPSISNYENKSMDDFIESVHDLFEEQSSKW